MTADEKSAIALFLDLTDDYLRDGYRRSRELYSFSDDPEPAGKEAASAEAVPESSGEAAPGFPDDSGDTPGPESPEAVAREISRCAACSLRAGRTRAVPGEGVPAPLALVIGEGPGADEDASGRPFVGRAGQLLDRILSGVGLYRDKNCFITNVVKCRPPGNRDPLPGEIAACMPFLERQIEVLKPRLILALGRVSANTLLAADEGIGRLRGSFTEYRPRNAEGRTVPLLATYHPSALLRDEGLKRPVWEDMKLLMGKLEGLDGAYAEEVRRLPVKQTGPARGTEQG
jgi:DNA polymerase